MDKDKIKFRASKAGLLMVGGKKITDKQLEELNTLDSRKTMAEGGLAKPLTTKMQERLDILIEKRDAPFELSETAKRYVEGMWMRDKYDYKPLVVTEVLLKGHLCEQDSMGLVQDLVEAQSFRMKNIQHFENGDFRGTPDVVLWDDGIIEDIKSCWDLKTFFEKKEVDPLYYAQGQVYMELTGLKEFKLHYCLVNTPMSLIQAEQRRFFFKFGMDEDNPHYQDACEQILANHSYDDKIPAEERLRTFGFSYDAEYMKEMKSRLDAARDYYLSLSLILGKS